jgi:hypothetical protein
MDDGQKRGRKGVEKEIASVGASVHDDEKGEIEGEKFADGLLKGIPGVVRGDDHATANFGGISGEG